MWVCQYCPKAYRWSTSLRRHLNHNHLDERQAIVDRLLARTEAAITKAKKEQQP